MHTVKIEPISGKNCQLKMDPARPNYQIPTVEDMAMPDFNSTFTSSGLPSSSEFVGINAQGSITPISEFSQSLPRKFLPPSSNIPPLTDLVHRNAIRSKAPSQESGLHIVGRRVQVLVDAINDIRGMGVDYLVDLPQLVLVGDQSAGKFAAKLLDYDNY